MSLGTDRLPKNTLNGLYPFGLNEPNVLTIGIWSYLDMDEEEDYAIAADSTQQGNHFVATGDGDLAVAGAGHVHENAAVFEETTKFFRSLRSWSEDLHRISWAVVDWIFIGTPSAEGYLLLWPDVEVKYTWDGSTLTFRQQVGFFADGTTPFMNEIAIEGLSAPINQWFYVAAVYRGPSTGTHFPLNDVQMTLRVNETSVSSPAPCLEAFLANPAHSVQTEKFVIDPGVCRIGPVYLYHKRTLSDADLDTLYNSGAGLALP